MYLRDAYDEDEELLTEDEDEGEDDSGTICVCAHRNRMYISVVHGCVRRGEYD